MPEIFVWLERCCLNRDEIPPGTLYLLILKTLARHGELHGYEIANSIQLNETPYTKGSSKATQGPNVA